MKTLHKKKKHVAEPWKYLQPWQIAILLSNNKQWNEAALALMVKNVFGYSLETFPLSQYDELNEIVESNGHALHWSRKAESV